LAENGASGPVIGLSLDGTGYGTDGNVWGGEVLIADLNDFRRVAHFEYVPMPGGEKAIKEPWRMALSYLNHAYGQELWNLPVKFVKSIEKSSARLVLAATEKRINTPLTSSLGRMFDGVAALVGIRGKVAFEGQAAMELEMAMYRRGALTGADSKYTPIAPSYRFKFDERDGVLQILIGEFIKQIVQDIETGVAIPTISLKFHESVVNIFVDICELLRERQNINRVAMSGGCFQNRYLSLELAQNLRQKDFEVLTHSIVPPNDGGLALGQAVVAASKMDGEEIY